jgi:nucleotide-binding universal stress UspA family protein
MKILVALDSREYSKNILKEVARLAQNTLADIVFLGVQDSGGEQKPQDLLVSTLIKYRHDVCNYFNPEELPYGKLTFGDFSQTVQGDWILSSKGIKDFTLRITTGSVARKVVAVAAEIECDLVILGCSGKLGCEWDGEMNVPLRIAKDASCSVLVIKQLKKSDQIVSILDQSIVSQDSLELVNQLVTLHEAGLKIVGVKEKMVGNKQDQMEKRMIELIRYYNERGIDAWVKLIGSNDVKDYVTVSSREAIVALWLGKQSLLKKLFSLSMVDKLLENTRSSLLILR